LTIAEVLIDKLDTLLPAMTIANGYRLTCNEVVKGFHPNYGGKSNNTIYYQLGNEKPNYLTEDGKTIAITELPFVLVYKCIVGKTQGKVIDVQEDAIYDLRRFINGDTTINVNYTLPKSLFAVSNNIQRVIPVEWERFPDINQGNFFAVVTGVMTYIENEQSITVYS